MKSIIKKFSYSVIIAAVVLSLSGFPFSASAGINDNVTGYAYSDMPDASDQVVTPANHYGGRGLGWISLNDTNHTGSPAPFAVNLDRSTGKFSGYGWSEFGGYVNFNPSSFPAGATDAHGAQVSASCLSGTTACNVTGWIQFISAANDPQSGGWDGYVKLSDSSWTPGVKLLAPDTSGTRRMSGYGWGDTVAGWVDFSKATVRGDLCPNIPGDQSSIPPGMGLNSQGDCVLDVCPNISGVQEDIPTGMIKNVDGDCVPPPRCIPPLVENPNYPPQEPACVCPVTFTDPVNGQCSIPPPTDICDNITGIQLTPADIPAGYAQPTDGSKICPATTCVPGKPCDKCWNVDGVQLTVPSQYNAVYPTNQCVIAGCTNSDDSVHYNPYATVDNGTCSVCTPNSKAWMEETGTCPACNRSTPGYDQTTGKCPKQPIKPIYIET